MATPKTFADYKIGTKFTSLPKRLQKFYFETDKAADAICEKEWLEKNPGGEWWYGETVQEHFAAFIKISGAPYPHHLNFEGYKKVEAKLYATI